MQKFHTNTKNGGKDTKRKMKCWKTIDSLKESKIEIMKFEEEEEDKNDGFITTRSKISHLGIFFYCHTNCAASHSLVNAIVCFFSCLCVDK